MIESTRLRKRNRTPGVCTTWRATFRNGAGIGVVTTPAKPRQIPPARRMVPPVFGEAAPSLTNRGHCVQRSGSAPCPGTSTGRLGSAWPALASSLDQCTALVGWVRSLRRNPPSRLRPPHPDPTPTPDPRAFHQEPSNEEYAHSPACSTYPHASPVSGEFIWEWRGVLDDGGPGPGGGFRSSPTLQERCRVSKRGCGVTMEWKLRRSFRRRMLRAAALLRTIRACRRLLFWVSIWQHCCRLNAKLLEELLDCLAISGI